jgi:lipid-binding SYLF domain-containing protein
MNTTFKALTFVLAAAFASLSLTSCSNGPLTQANAANSSKAQIASSSRAALHQLYAANPKARWLGSRAKAVLVFPSIVKGGFMVGAMGGNGALIWRNGSIRNFYQTVGLSYGLQAGVQTYGYALFLMDDSALRSVNNSKGWEVGSAPSLVVLDQGMSASLSTNTIQKSIYAVFFNQQGLMGGLGLQGSKITPIYPAR